MRNNKLLPVKLGGLFADSNLVRLAVIMAASFVLMASMNPRMYLTVNNFRSMAFQFPEIGLLAVAVMIAMLMGGIDLSVLGIANLSAIMSAYIMIAAKPVVGGWGAVLIGILVSLMIGLLCGAFNGFLVAYVGIPAMLATLGAMEIFTGIGVYVTKGAAVFGLPDEFAYLGSASIGMVPMPLIIFIVVVSVYITVLQRGKFGLEVYLMGTSRKAAQFTGILTKRTIVKAHMMGGLLAAIAGIIMSSRTVSAKADYGSSYTLQAILVAVLGGTNPSGGFGKVTGVIMAILTLQFLSSGFNMMRADSYFRTFIWGAVLVLTLIINYFGNKLSEKKKINAMKNIQNEEETK